MSGPVAAGGLAIASIIASLFIGPELGFLLAIAAFIVVVSTVLDEPAARERRDAKRRNQAHRR